MAKQVSVEIEVNSSQVDKTVQKLGELKDLGRGLKIQYDIDGKPIDIAIDKSLNLQKQVKILTAELRRTKEGTAEFQMLSSRLGQAQDELAKTTAKSKDLFSSLSMIPGPIGQFFSQLQGGIELLKTFSSFTFKDLSFQFKETADDIADIGKNLADVDAGAIDTVKNSADDASDSINNMSDSLGKVAGESAGTSVAIDRVVKSTKTSANEFDTVQAAMANLTANGFKPLTEVAGASGDILISVAGQTKTLNSDQIKLAATNKILTASIDGSTGALVLMTQAEKTATFWTTTLGTTIKTVLISTGILAAIVVLGELVAMLYRYVSGTEDAEAATRSLTSALEEQQRVLQNDLDALEMANKAAITRAKIAGKSEEEISRITREGNANRLAELIKYDEQLFQQQRNLSQNTKISAEDREKLAKDINDKILKNGQDITKQILSNEQFRLDEQLRVAEKGRESSKKIQEKKTDDTKQGLTLLTELEQSNAVLRESEAQKRDQLELENAKKNEEKKIKDLEISSDLEGKLLLQVKEKYELKLKELNKKYDDERIKKQEEQGQKVADYAGKLEDMRIAAIADANLKEVEQRRNKFSEEIKDLDKALKDKLITQEQYNAALLNLQKTLDNDLQKIADDKKKKENDDLLKKLDDDIRFLEISNNAQKNSFVAYWQGRQEILDTAKQRELAALNLTEDQKHAIEKKYVQLSKDLQREKFQAYLGYVSAGLSAVAGFYSQQQTINGLAMDNELAKVKDNAVEQDKIKEKYFYKNQKAQKGQAVIATLQSAIQAFSALAGIPVVGPVLGAAAAAAALVFGYKQVDLIGKQTYQSGLATTSGGEATVAAPQNMGKNYEQGGLIGGRRHAEGGTLIEAEKGEAIMTRGAVTMFAPLLSTLNQMGGGTSFARSAMTTSFDAPVTAQPSQEQAPIIVKSYVVSSELTSEQNKQARLKDLSTL
jgi:hypothetical protein